MAKYPVFRHSGSLGRVRGGKSLLGLNPCEYGAYGRRGGTGFLASGSGETEAKQEVGNYSRKITQDPIRRGKLRLPFLSSFYIYISNRKKALIWAAIKKAFFKLREDKGVRRRKYPFYEGGAGLGRVGGGKRLLGPNPLEWRAL